MTRLALATPSYGWYYNTNFRVCQEFFLHINEKRVVHDGQHAMNCNRELHKLKAHAFMICLRHELRHSAHCFHHKRKKVLQILSIRLPVSILQILYNQLLVSRKFARRGAPRNAGDGVVTYSEPSIAGATKYCEFYTISIASPKEKNLYRSLTATS